MRKPSYAPKPVPCLRCPLRRRSIFRAFEPSELNFVEWFKTSELIAPKGGNVLLEGAASQHLFTVLEGWGFRHKTLPDGRRQILNYVLPGDFLGLQGPIFKEMQHSVEALTQLRLCVFPRDRLWTLYEKHPALAHDLVWLAMRGEQQADEHLLSVGRRSAAERIAYLFLHLYDRCQALDMLDHGRFKVPFAQMHVADTIGLSLVHTHRAMRQMQARGLFTWSREEIEIHDRAALEELSNYAPAPDEKRPII